MSGINPSRVWFVCAFNLILTGLLCYGVYWLGVASGMAMAGVLIGGITFLVIVGLQGYAVFRKLRDPTWNPAAPPFQIDSKTYSRLTIAAKMLVGSPLNLPAALSKIAHREKKKSETDKNI
jgi:FtsH-binding integral membrane protein